VAGAAVEAHPRGGALRRALGRREQRCGAAATPQNWWRTCATRRRRSWYAARQPGQQAPRGAGAAWSNALRVFASQPASTPQTLRTARRLPATPRLLSLSGRGCAGPCLQGGHHRVRRTVCCVLSLQLARPHPRPAGGAQRRRASRRLGPSTAHGLAAAPDQGTWPAPWSAKPAHCSSFHRPPLLQWLCRRGPRSTPPRPVFRTPPSPKQVFPKSIEVMVPAICIGLVVPSWLYEEATHRVVGVSERKRCSQGGRLSLSAATAQQVAARGPSCCLWSPPNPRPPRAV
jgi:hypothetical protein